MQPTKANLQPSKKGKPDITTAPTAIDMKKHDAYINQSQPALEGRGPPLIRKYATRARQPQSKVSRQCRLSPNKQPERHEVPSEQGKCTPHMQRA